MRDNFPYYGRWDSVGLDCSNCRYFQPPAEWPDSSASIRCLLHQKSLAIELAPNGYKEGEWFCVAFENNGSVRAKALAHLEYTRHELRSGILYRLQGSESLGEVEIATLDPAAN